MANLFSRLRLHRFYTDASQEGYAVGRVNTLLARIFAAGGLAVGLQMLLNAWSQRDMLIPIWFWPGFLMVAAGQVGLLYAAFFSGKNVFWQRWYARSIEAVIVTWFLAVPPGTHLPEGLYPWAWWGVGLAGVAAFAGLPPMRALIFLVALNLFWFIARFFPEYGGVGLWLNIQDTLLTFLFSGLSSALVLVTRYEASRVDLASARKIAAAADQARVETEIREKSRLGALVHDKVLTALLLAAKATTPEEKAAASDLAIKAITKLNEPARATDGALISGRSFFEALTKIALGQDALIRVSKSENESIELPDNVGGALTEAVLQAIINSQQHAGSWAVRELHLKSNSHGIKIVIKDNGRGFRMSRVPKNRFGIRVSIIERVQAAGGRAFIDSRPGAGTNIIIEWDGAA